jgi:hypothetical protein
MFIPEVGDFLFFLFDNNEENTIMVSKPETTSLSIRIQRNHLCAYGSRSWSIIGVCGCTVIYLYQ